MVNDVYEIVKYNNYFKLLLKILNISLITSLSIKNLIIKRNPDINTLGNLLLNIMNKMSKEKVASDEYKLETWLDFTSQNEMMIHSDSILTIVTPTAAILSEYVDLIA